MEMMMKNGIAALTAIAGIAALVLAGCAGTTKMDDGNIQFKEKKVNARFDNTGLIRQVFDMNHDGVVDLWKFYEVKKASDDETDGQRLLIRKELDMNFDETVDRIMYYNQKENLIREEIDANFNGSIDRIQYYDNGLIVKTEIYSADCNSVAIDGKDNPQVRPNLVRHYRKGLLTREERDDACDGVRETITIFNDKGEVSQIGYDHDGNGIVEQWIRY